jgi:hypothetical protein
VGDRHVHHVVACPPLPQSSANTNHQPKKAIAKYKHEPTTTNHQHFQSMVGVGTNIQLR